MVCFEKEPTKDEEEEFEKIEKVGGPRVNEYSGLSEKLGPHEKIQMMSTFKIKDKDKSIIALTNKRLIVYNSEKTKLLGKRRRFEDIRLEDILDIQVEERKGFDIMRITTKEQKMKMITTEGRGVKISGHIRDLQDKIQQDPVEQLERIGAEREKGNISDEEYEEKKKELMDRI
ncbi:PH domain-containing protein [Methanonatronarchaeum sp. AMET-Sl]|uniref:PH domain-containing protein n=1 Tax=Methanonatronarchaeum sp. AMET-Sl TaxID=3037654 RepID=UPI00244DBA53|nr:PH domain-containing protein [Methanonatronarchaeum sp. AMET-Sl]WGI17065.1 PH domain-containing protein [Methanonatronarchaeum sp. AMET-Sl]